MRNLDWQQMGMVAVATIAALIVYSFIWKKSKVLGVLVLVVSLAAFVFFCLDWPYWKEYFFVNPGGKLGDYVAY